MSSNSLNNSRVQKARIQESKGRERTPAGVIRRNYSTILKIIHIIWIAIYFMHRRPPPPPNTTLTYLQLVVEKFRLVLEIDIDAYRMILRRFL